MRTAAFIFDMDGTLVDNMPLHIAAWIALFQDRDMTVTAEDYYAAGVGDSAEEVVRYFLGEYISDAHAKTWVGEKEFLYRYLARRKMKLLRGLRRFLSSASRDSIPFTLATSVGQRNIDFFLETCGLEGCFDVVLRAESVTRTKPHPDVFLKATSRLGVPSADCLVFEDSFPGLEAARRAGMRAVAVATMHTDTELRTLPQVIAVIQDYAGLSPAFLTSLAHDLEGQNRGGRSGAQ